MFYLSGLILFVYILCRLILPLSVGWKRKLVLGIILLVISQRNLLMRFVMGTLASPELPPLVLVITGWLYVSFVLLMMLLLLKDAVAIVLWLVSRFGPDISLPLTAGQWGIALPVIGGLLGIYGVWQAIRVPDVKVVEIRHMPKALDGMTIVQISDLHVSAMLNASRTRGVVDKIKALQPDLILFTGDTIDGSPARRAQDVAALPELRAKYGIYGIAGNHEYYSNYRVWEKQFISLGITMLDNRHITLMINGQPLIIAGVTDQAAKQYDLPGPDIKQALAGIPANAVIILMEHRPNNARSNAATGVNLQLSGHTHGGQVIGMNWLVARFNEGFVAGLYSAGKMQLYVSAGTGLWNGFPARVGVPAEITKFILRSDL